MEWGTAFRRAFLETAAELFAEGLLEFLVLLIFEMLAGLLQGGL
jgi:hypothetical protein